MNKRGVTTKRNWGEKITKKSTHPWHIDCTSVADRRLFRLVTSLWFWLRLSFFLLRGCHSSVFITVAVFSAHFFASWSCGPCTSTRRRFVAFSSRIAIFYRLNRLFLLSTSYLGFVDVPRTHTVTQRKKARNHLLQLQTWNDPPPPPPPPHTHTLTFCPV